MSAVSFESISVLVVDDFVSFRNTMTTMLTKLGVKKIEEAGKASEMLKWCQSYDFDLVLCDYNLGSERNGQNLLEEMHYRNLIKPKTLFVMVTAENSKEMVLSAYDCKPADYLIKPINQKVLENRLTRLLITRNTLLEAQQLVEVGQEDKAIAILRKKVSAGGRGAVTAQKLLGELYLSTGKLDLAEKLYMEVLENRDLDWASLGMAKIWIEQKKYKEAEELLDKLLKNCRYYLPAYDAITEIYTRNLQHDKLFDHLKEVVSICPGSITRQRSLAHTAERCGEVLVQLQASHTAAKLGDTSCHRDFNDVRQFVSAAVDVLESNTEYKGMDLMKETSRLVNKAHNQFKMTPHDIAVCEFLEARTLYLAGSKEAADRAYADAHKGYDHLMDHQIDTDLVKYSCMCSAGNEKEAEAFLQSVVAYYYDDEHAKQRLDKYLPEPISEENKARIVNINKEGISLYKEDRFDEAVDCFSRAVLAFPRHIGLQLNYLQSLISKLKVYPGNTAERNRLLLALDSAKKAIPPSDTAKLERFDQLNDLARKALTAGES